MTGKSSSERGAALLSILMIVAALAVAALAATTAIARQTDYAKAARSRSDAGWAAYSAEALARSTIADVWLQTGGRISASLPMFGEPVSIPVRGGFVTLTVSDASNCFNINTLANPDEGAARLARMSWAALLRDLDISSGEANDLADALADWLDNDSTPRPGGAEDGYYLTLSPAYRTANQPMDSPSELAAVRGYTPALQDALAGVVCARRQPASTQLNINTIRPDQAVLLRALFSEALPLAAAERILMSRPATGWVSLESFESLPDVATIPPGQRRSENLSVSSSFFAAEGRAHLDGGSWPFSFIIQAENGMAPKTVWRRLGEE